MVTFIRSNRLLGTSGGSWSMGMTEPARSGAWSNDQEGDNMDSGLTRRQILQAGVAAGAAAL